MAMILSNMNIECKVHLDRVHVSWDKYNDTANYTLIKKKNSRPTSLEDGTLVYSGKRRECEDYKVKNGTIYYYRLFIFHNPDNEFDCISDNKCVARVIAINSDEMVDYGKYLYKKTPLFIQQQDAQQKNFPLQRFMSLCAYVFNKINAYDSLELNQLDIEECDESYLSYHARWIGTLYDKRFGADINRLIEVSINEAEAYRGTIVGLKYILQRVFKAEVEISEEYNSGHSVYNICLYFDDNNKWLSNMQTCDSITKIILDFCALRVDFDIVYKMYSKDEYDRYRMSDYLHDYLIEKILTQYDKQIVYECADYISEKSADEYEITSEESVLDNVSVLSLETDKHDKQDTQIDIVSDLDSSIYEVVGSYEDEIITNVTRSRPMSLTCSECVIGSTLFTTDILY